MKNKIQISIIIPCYNCRKYIEDCVGSLHPGKHPEIEVILVNDGSTDDTLNCLDAISSECENIKTVNQGNRGSSAARNIGLTLAKGTWVWFVDSDDLVSPNALNILLAVSLASSADAIHFGLTRFNDGENPIWKGNSSSPNTESFTAAEFIKRLHRGEFEHFSWTYLFRRDSLGITGSGNGAKFFHEELSLFEDVVTIESFLQTAGSIDVIAATMYAYRQVPSSLSHLTSESAADSGLRAIREVECIYKDSIDQARLNMEISFLFNSYRIAPLASKVKFDIAWEIDNKVRKVGIFRLGFSRLLRYFLLKTGLMDCVLELRSRANG